MNNRSLENIRNSFKNAAKAFEGVQGEEHTYQILNSLAEKQMNPSEMLEELRKIGNEKNYPEVLESYFYQRYKELESLAKQEKEKDELTEELKEKHEELENKLRDRKYDYSVNTDDFGLDYNADTTYNKMDLSIEQLKENIEIIDNRINSLDEKRKSGDALEEPKEDLKQISGIEATTYNNPNNTINEMNQKFTKANEQASSYKEYTNLTPEDMMTLYNYAEEKQTSDALLVMDIEYQNDNSVIVTLSHEGSNVPADLEKSVCYFPDKDDFNKNVLPKLVDAHIEGDIAHEATVENGEMESYNEQDEGLTMSGNEEMSLYTASYINRQLKNSKDKGIVRIREIDNKGYNNRAIYVVLFWIGIIALITVLYLLFIKK